MNKLVPSWFAISRAIAVASYLGEVLDEYVLTKIPDNPYTKYEGMVIAPVVARAGTLYLAIAPVVARAGTLYSVLELS